MNNAGIQTFGDPVTTTEEVWDKTMNVNLKGHWLMSKYAIPEMLKRGKGSIVNVSSVQGLASPQQRRCLFDQQTRDDRPDAIDGRRYGIAQCSRELRVSRHGQHAHDP